MSLWSTAKHLAAKLIPLSQRLVRPDPHHLAQAQAAILEHLLLDVSILDVSPDNKEAQTLHNTVVALVRQRLRYAQDGGILG